MTFDDGILTIYSVENIGNPGFKPVAGLMKKESYCFGYDTLGITRYYTALQAKQQIEAVVNVPGWNDITTLDICILENGKQYKIVMVQPAFDEQGLKITKLSLERISEEYAIKN